MVVHQSGRSLDVMIGGYIKISVSEDVTTHAPVEVDVLQNCVTRQRIVAKHAEFGELYKYA